MTIRLLPRDLIERFNFLKTKFPLIDELMISQISKSVKYIIDSPMILEEVFLVSDSYSEVIKIDRTFPAETVKVTYDELCTIPDSIILFYNIITAQTPLQQSFYIRKIVVNKDDSIYHKLIEFERSYTIDSIISKANTI
jgi:hypothetical protein